jgi:hypothetical protein
MRQHILKTTDLPPASVNAHASHRGRSHGHAARPRRTSASAAIRRDVLICAYTTPTVREIPMPRLTIDTAW